VWLTNLKTTEGWKARWPREQSSISTPKRATASSPLMGARTSSCTTARSRGRVPHAGGKPEGRVRHRGGREGDTRGHQRASHGRGADHDNGADLDAVAAGVQSWQRGPLLHHLGRGAGQGGANLGYVDEGVACHV
jgi:hypothetical protein